MPNNNNKKIKVRMAPSPTGNLHVGTARTALFNYLYAKHYGGEFVMRIEDTDKERSKKEYEENILEGLKWLGIEWDGVPVRQSERIDIYQKHIKRMLEEGSAFYCWHTKEELDAEQKQQQAEKRLPRHFCEYRDGQPETEEQKKNSIVRIKNNKKGDITFNDEVRGEVKFKAENLGDFSIAKDTETALYNLAVVIDDNEMDITHVIRGEDHISNTPKQILIQEALGFDAPQYVHIPLLLNPDRSKLSKRYANVSVSDYKEEGYLSQAMFNFLALLGWRSEVDDEKEVMSHNEIIKEFTVGGIQKTPAIFDVEKLKWMNGEYIRKLSTEEFKILCEPFIQKEFEGAGYDWEKDDKTIKKALQIEKTRVKTLSELKGALDFVFNEPDYDPELLVWRKSTKKETIEVLPEIYGIIDSIEGVDWVQDKLQEILMPEAEKTGDRGSFLWPLRVALSGKEHSPGPFEIMEVLGKTKTLQRIQRAIDLLNK